VSALRRLSRAGLEKVEGAFNRAFGPAWNPFYQLGALGWFFYWITIVSGVYLFVFFDTGIHQAYASLEYITNVQWYAGGVMRSLHRYASDALIIVMMLHLLREYIMDRLRGARWFSWVTGVPLLWLVFACGISGYWMVWDVLAQYIAIASTEWLDALGIFGEPIARNFLNPEALSGRFFTLMVFIHIAVPLLMLLVMWIHIQRQTNARVNPAKGLTLGTLGALVALSLVEPAVSQAPADLSKVTAVVNLDWFYLAAYPLLDRVPGGTLWAVFGGATLLLLALPWLPPGKREAPAVVDLGNCNGCGRCVADCPYTAIAMKPRSDGAAFTQEAVVEASLCVSCGICVGSCPTATPFRRTTELVPGIDLPDLTVRTLREQTLSVAKGLSGTPRVLVFGCPYGPALRALEAPGVAVLELPCIAMLPPSFLDFVITRKHADGVLLTGCPEGNCHHRLGIDWSEQRLVGERDPYLRKRVPRERIRECWVGVSGSSRLQKELAAFRDELVALGPLERARSPKASSAPAREQERGE